MSEYNARKAALDGSVIGKFGCGITVYSAPEAGSSGPSPKALLEIRPVNSRLNQLKSRFRPERFTPRIGSLGVKLKPVLHCFSVCGPSVLPFLRITAAPDPPPLTTSPPGFRSAAFAEQGLDSTRPSRGHTLATPRRRTIDRTAAENRHIVRRRQTQRVYPRYSRLDRGVSREGRDPEGLALCSAGGQETIPDAPVDR